MGGSESVGSFELNLDGESFSAGEAVQGTLTLQLEKRVAATALRLTLKGVETCALLETDVNVDPMVSLLNRGATSCFSTTTLPISSIPDHELCPGPHSFPFSFPTSSALPGSFEYREKWKKVSITYTLAPSFSSSRALLTGKPAVVKLTPRLEQSTRQLIFGQQISLLSCGCVCKGSVDVRISCDKPAYEVGQTAEIDVEIDTSLCTGAIKKVGIGVIYTLTFQRSFGVEKELSRRWVSGKKLNSDHKDLRLSVPIREKEGAFFPFSAVGSKLKSEYSLKVVVMLENNALCGSCPEKQMTLPVFPQRSFAGGNYDPAGSRSESDLEVPREDRLTSGEEAARGEEKKIEIL